MPLQKIILRHAKAHLAQGLSVARSAYCAITMESTQKYVCYNCSSKLS